MIYYNRKWLIINLMTTKIRITSDKSSKSVNEIYAQFKINYKSANLKFGGYKHSFAPLYVHQWSLGEYMSKIIFKFSSLNINLLDINFKKTRYFQSCIFSSKVINFFETCQIYKCVILIYGESF